MNSNQGLLYSFIGLRNNMTRVEDVAFPEDRGGGW